MSLKTEEAAFKRNKSETPLETDKQLSDSDMISSQLKALEENISPEYEKMLQKLEGEVRNHIKIE